MDLNIKEATEGDNVLIGVEYFMKMKVAAHLSRSPLWVVINLLHQHSPRPTFQSSCELKPDNWTFMEFS